MIFHKKETEKIELVARLDNSIAISLWKLLFTFQPAMISHLPPIESPNVAPSHSEMWKKESETTDRTGGDKDRKNPM